MAFEVKVIEDSVNSMFGTRLSTLTLQYPRFIHSEVLTHRDRARNSASSRAIPWPKMRDRILNEPVIPIIFGSEQKGMQTGGEIDDPEAALKVWLAARDDALRHAEELAALGVHKSIVNRLTEPFMWITVVMTSTNWNNFKRLRCHPDAEVHFQKIAKLAEEALAASTPVVRPVHSYPEEDAECWHLPYVTAEERREFAEDPLLLAEWSTARNARVSYMTHEGVPSQAKDSDLFSKLCQGSGFGHWSPHEHAAHTMSHKGNSGPFRDWRQFRKFFPNECAPE